MFAAPDDRTLRPSERTDGLVTQCSRRVGALECLTAMIWRQGALWRHTALQRRGVAWRGGKKQK